MTHKEELDSVMFFKDLSEFDFLQFGVHHLAYIKRVEDNDQVSYIVHAADGRILSSLDDRASAFAAIMANDMEPVLLQ